MSDYYQSLYGFSNNRVVFPEKLVIGDSWHLRLVSERYGGEPADGPWTASLSFAADVSKLTVDATQVEAVFEWEILPDDTQTLHPGPYQYVVQVSNGTLRRTIEQGGIHLEADITTSSPVKAESIKEKQLEAVDKTLLRLLNQETSSTEFAGKTYHLWDVEALQRVRNHIYREVMDERRKKAGQNRYNLIIPFIRSGY